MTLSKEKNGSIRQKILYKKYLIHTYIRIDLYLDEIRNAKNRRKEPQLPIKIEST